jgi:hypothetical protein
MKEVPKGFVLRAESARVFIMHAFESSEWQFVSEICKGFLPI